MRFVYRQDVACSHTCMYKHCNIVYFASIARFGLENSLASALPYDIGMAMLHIGAEQLDFSKAGLLQRILEVNVLSHLDLLVKQRRLALPR